MVSGQHQLLARGGRELIIPRYQIPHHPDQRIQIVGGNRGGNHFPFRLNFRTILRRHFHRAARRNRSLTPPGKINIGSGQAAHLVAAQHSGCGHRVETILRRQHQRIGNAGNIFIRQRGIQLRQILRMYDYIPCRIHRGILNISQHLRRILRTECIRHFG